MFSSPLRTTLWLGLATFTALLLLAAVFYLERIGHIDMSFQTFLILGSGNLEIQSGRFGAAVTQLWPWLAQAMHLPLRAVLLSYSLGHVFWPLFLFLWCCWLRQWQWALVLLLVVVGMPTQTFYWLSEMPQGLVMLAAIFAWLQQRARYTAVRWWQWLLFFAAIVTVFYFHPLIMYAALFGCLFFMMPRSEQRPLYGIMLLGFALVAILKYKVLKLDWYDAVSIERAEAFGQLWPHWVDIPSNRDLLHWMISDYYFVPLALLAAAGFYIWKKNWLQAALVTLYPLAYIFMVNVPFHESAQQFYMENLYLPLGFFAALPLVFDVLPGLLPPRRSFAVLALILSVGLLRIGFAHQSWTDRLAWERDFLNKTAQWPAKKLLLTEDQVPMATLKMTWGTPYEFLLLSSLAGPDSARCILVTNEPARYDSIMLTPRTFLGTFKNFKFEALPSRYFNLQDTSAYQRLGK